MSRSTRSRAATIGVLVGLATPALMLAPQAAAAAGRTYSAKISPTAVKTGGTATFTVTITNNSALGSLVGIKTATITVPSAFTINSVGPASPSSWTVSRSGQKVTIQSGLLLPGGSVSVPITATAPATTGGFTWATSSSGALGPFTRIGPDPSVTVAQSVAVVVCNANTPCVSPTLSAGASPTALATDAQVTAQSGPQPDLLTVVLPDPTAAPMLCQQTNGTFGQIVTWNVTSRTSTLLYTVHPTDPNYTYDLGDTCFGSTQQFPGAVQNPANGNEWEGTLPFCSVSSDFGPQTNPPPCVESIVSTPFDSDNDGDPADTTTGDDIPVVTVTVDAPQGDPKFTG
jgi:hypothetical protein